MRSSLNTKICRSKCSDGERGAVLVEWAIVAAGLFLGFIISFDIAQAVNSYMLLTQAAYEGARFASRIPGMEPGTHTDVNPSQDEINDCVNRNTTTVACNHYFCLLYTSPSPRDS